VTFMMETKSLRLSLAAAASVGLAVGLSLARLRLQAPPTSSPVAEAGGGAISEAPSRIGRMPAGTPFGPRPTRLVEQLERQLIGRSGLERRLAWLEAMDTAAAADFPDLALLARDDSGILRSLASRWVEVDAPHFFQTLLKELRHPRGLPVQPMSRILFEEWPRKNPEQAISALNDAAAGGIPQSWQTSVATAVFQTDVERGIRLFSDWRVENYIPFGDSGGPVPKWAAANPRHAAEVALKNPAGSITQAVLALIGHEWGKIDPTGALAFAAENGGSSGTTLGREALDSWSSLDRTAASAWLASADDSTRRRLSPGFAKAWASSDPASALVWCTDHLSGSSLASAVSAVVQGAGPKRVAEAAALVLSMEPSPARSEAAAAVADLWFPSLGGMEGPSGRRTVAPETLAWLGTLDAPSVRRVLEKETWSWATSDPTSMAEFLLTRIDQPVGEWAETCLAREWARQAPLLALEWSGKLPGNRALEAGGEAYATWRLSQPDEATRWLQDLPTGDPRRDAFFRSHLRSLAYDPRAIDLIASMSPPDRERARSALQEMGDLPPETRTRLLEASVPPSR